MNRPYTLETHNGEIAHRNIYKTTQEMQAAYYSRIGTLVSVGYTIQQHNHDACHVALFKPLHGTITLKGFTK